MYNPEQKQVIVKNSLGVSYHIFYEAGRGLCVRMLGESGVWSRGYVLSDKSVNDFSVILDKDDIFHFVSQSIDGQILYGHGRHGQIEIQTVLTSKDTTPWMKHVSLTMYKDVMLLFYSIRYQKKFLLSMQIIKDTAFSKPTAIDYTDGPGMNYRVVADKTGHCRLFYTNNEGPVKRLNQRLYNEETELFSAPERLVGSEHEIILCSAIGLDNRAHLLYQVSSENLYQLFYRTDGNVSECLYKGTSPPGYTGLVYHSGFLRVFRISSDCIYSRTSGDNGESWTDEALVPLGTGTSLTCFTYFTNYFKEQELSCHELPGTFTKGYQLAFMQNEAAANPFDAPYPDVSRPRTPESHERKEYREDERKPEHRNEIPDASILKELQKKVLLLQNLTGNMQRDLTKLWLAQKGHEKKLARLERFYEHLKNEPRSSEEEAGNSGRKDISSEPALQWETTMQSSGDTDAAPEASPTELEEDFYDDDDAGGSEEENIKSWYKEEYVPDIVQ
ncbi:MAG: hypothetical protein KBA53_08280 [Thermoclostridium sp.]|nr:hypothetical protein [Thermoclostridium sp.]